MINSIPISIIIPTHNRIGSLLKILKALSEQNFNQNDFEVIIVADNCIDDTVNLISKTTNQFLFRIEAFNVQFGNSAAARNAGADKARGSHLIFLDDDIIPFHDFIHQHYSNRKNNQVIVGYSKPMFSKRPSVWQQRARRWWEDRFYEMSQPGHRFNFMDFFSGNFSINRDLFFSLGGFAKSLKRHEDYEFGLKLLKAGIKFKFSYQIGGYHYETNDLKKWLRRQKLYGYSNVRMINLHPEVSEYFFKETFELYGLYHIIQLFVKRLAFKKNFAILYLMKILLSSLYISEKLRLYSMWEKIVGVLVVYNYWNGVSSELGTYKNYLLWHTEIRKKKYAIENRKSIELKDILESDELILDGNPELSITSDSKTLVMISAKDGGESLNRNHIIAEVERKFLENINPFAYSSLSQIK
ncbi:MAG: glycosyltransferase [Ignavibacteriales bacterium]|nr:MAG: glycosyltransferase [Ignavibacteriales bacterium]